MKVAESVTVTGCMTSSLPAASGFQKTSEGMQSLHKTAVATLRAVTPLLMPAFPHAAPTPDLPLAVLLAQDELTTRLNLLALEAGGDPSASIRLDESTLLPPKFFCLLV